MRKLIFLTFLLIASVAHAEEQVMSWSYPAGSGVWTVSMSSDGKYIAAGGYDNNVYFFDSGGSLLWKYKTGDTVWAVAISSDGKYTVAGSKDRSIYFFDSTGKLLWNYKTGDTVWTVSISSDGKYIAAGSYDNHVYFFDSAGSLLWKYKTGDVVLSTSLSSDGKYIAAGSYDNNVYFFDLKGSLLWNYKTNDVVLSTSVSSDGKYIAAGSYDNYVYFFDSKGSLLWKYKALDIVLSTSMSSDGKYIAAGSYDNYVYFFDSKGSLLWKYRANDEIWDVALSLGGEYVAAGSRDNSVYFLNSSGTLFGKYKTAYYVSSVATSMDGNYTVAGSYDNNVYFFKKVQPMVEAPKLPKLSVAKSVLDAVLVEGESTIVEISIKNLGEGNATNVRFSDSIPEGLELIDGKAVWSGELKAEETMVISYKLRAKKLPGAENATYQLPRLDVVYEDARGAVYHVESTIVSLTVVPKIIKITPTPPPELTLKEKIVQRLYDLKFEAAVAGAALKEKIVQRLYDLKSLVSMLLERISYMYAAVAGATLIILALFLGRIINIGYKRRKMMALRQIKRGMGSVKYETPPEIKVYGEKAERLRQIKYGVKAGGR